MDQQAPLNPRDAALAYVYALAQVACHTEGARRLAATKLAALGGEQALSRAQRAFHHAGARRLEPIEQARQNLNAGRTDLADLPDTAEGCYIGACAALARDKSAAGCRTAAELLQRALMLDGANEACLALLGAIAEETGAAASDMRRRPSQ